MPGSLDPVLALLDYLEEYRRSWRCWLTGGPAAVDDLSIGGARQGTGARLSGDYQYEREETRCRWLPAFLARRRMGAGRDAPEPPPEGEFRTECWERYTADTRRGSRLPGLRRFQVVRRLYQHAHAAHDLLAPEGDGPEARALLAQAMSTDALHTPVTAPTAEELRDRLEETGLVSQAYAERLSRVRSEPAPGGYPHRRHGKLLHQRLGARVTHAAAVSVHVGRRWGRFLGFGLGSRFEAELLWGLHVAPVHPLCWPVVAALFGVINASVKCLFGEPPWDEFWHDFSFALLFQAGLLIYHRWRTTGGPVVALGHVWASRRARPVPTIAVVGPDARASGVLFSLFAHLASAAQMADPTEGGLVLDDAYEALPAMLDPRAPAPGWSGTYRVRLGAVPDGRVVRLVHVVRQPDGGSDELVRRTLARAEQVWLVLPAAQASAAAALARSWPPASEKPAKVKLVLDTRETTGRAAGDRAPNAGGTVWAVDLRALRDRYLAGSISPGEAAGWIAALAGEDERPPARAQDQWPMQTGTESADNRRYPRAAGARPDRPPGTRTRGSGS